MQEDILKEPRKISVAFQNGTCPLRCKKCIGFSGNQSRKLKVEKMPLEKAKIIIDEIAHMKKVPILSPALYAETFANTDLRVILEWCKEGGIPLSIITNGILFNEEWADFVLENLNRNDTLSFSLDAVSQSVYEQVRGAYSLRDIEDKIHRLLNARIGSKGPRVVVSMTIEEENEQEKQSFIDKWKYVADGVRIDIAFNLNRKIPERYRKDSKPVSQGCANLMDMAIDANGNVIICCDDVFGDTYYGNVFDKGIMGVWNSEAMNEIRYKLNNGQLKEGDYCYGCEAGIMTGIKTRETEDFIVKEADYWCFYNLKERWNNR